jgi:peptidoglycan hydrolase CwlO-like protein
MAELEIVQQEHANALVHIAELHDDVQELKEKQTELHTIVIKLSAGQALSPAEAKKVTDENNNTVKV